MTFRQAACFAALVVSAPAWGDQSSPTYFADVRPILARRCIACHSEKHLDDPEVSGRLSLATPERVLAKGNRAVVTLGRPDVSPLAFRLTHPDAEKRMPKDDDPLPAGEVAIIRKWIELGAPLGTPSTEVAYRRRESRHPKKLHDLAVKLNVTAPDQSFAGSKGGPVQIVAPLGPLAPVTSVCFSPDGRWLACGSFRKVAVWDLKTGALAAALTDPIGLVHALKFSPDGKRLWMAGGEPSTRGELRSWKTGDWKADSEVAPSHDVLFGLDVSSDGRLIACVGYDRMLRLYDLPQLRERWTVKAHSDYAYSVAFSPDGRQLVTCGKDKQVKLWSVASGKSDRTLTGHREEVYAAVFGRDGGPLFSGGLEPQLRKWTVDKSTRSTVTNGHGVAIHQMAWNASRTRFITAGGDKVARVWKPDGGSERLLVGAGDGVYSAALSPDASVAAAASADGIVRLWQVSTGKLAASLYVGDPTEKHGPEWLAATATGFVNPSPALAEQSHWLVGKDSIAFGKAPPGIVKAAEAALAMQGKQGASSPFAAPPAKKPPTKKAK